MPLDSSTIDGVTDCYTFVVAADGDCVLHPRVPTLVGTKPWDWCVEEDRELCREAFVDACMFRKESVRFQARVLYEGRVFRLDFRLFPLETGQVLCLFRRLFEDNLTKRERHVLVLVAGGADPAEVATVLGITKSTARDHIASVKRKLNVAHAEGFRMAAAYFGLGGGLGGGLSGGVGEEHPPDDA